LAPVSNQPWRDDREDAHHLRTVVAHGGSHNLSAFLRGQSAKAHQQDASGDFALTKNVFSKIAITGDKNGAPMICVSENCVIIDAGRNLSDVRDVVARATELVDHLLVDILIAQKLHAASFGVG
jgi:hypothetical protein